MDKCKTGIVGLDNILDGGIPIGNSILLAGSSGTGKTIMAMEFLFRGAKEAGETGVYISLSEPKSKVLRHIGKFKFYDQKIIDKNKVIIVDVTEDAHLRGIEMQTVSGIMSMIRSIIKNNNAKRAVIDSITAICDSLGTDQKRRDFVLELGFQLSYMGCTTLMISEIPPQTFVYSVFGVEEFVSDGVILLTEFERKADLIRTLRVVKMRGVNHSRTNHVIEITEDGIKLLPMFEE